MSIKSTTNKVMLFAALCVLTTSCDSEFWGAMSQSLMGYPVGGGVSNAYAGSTYSGGTYSSSGSSSSSSSSSSGSSSSGKMCTLCVGTGTCKTCNGSGIARDEQFGTGKSYKCPNCKGNGKCFSCKGTGRH